MRFGVVWWWWWWVCGWVVFILLKLRPWRRGPGPQSGPGGSCHHDRSGGRIRLGKVSFKLHCNLIMMEAAELKPNDESKGPVYYIHRYLYRGTGRDRDKKKILEQRPLGQPKGFTLIIHPPQVPTLAPRPRPSELPKDWP